MSKHLFTIIATILVVSSALKAQLQDLVHGEYGPGLVTVEGDCYTDPRYGDLTFNPGTSVQFNDHYQILIVGGTAMYANGTEAAPILFTSPPGNPTPGYWKALVAEGSSGNYATMTLNNCEIRYGGETVPPEQEIHAYGVVRCYDSSHVTISDCYFHDNLGSGVGTDHDGAGNNLLELQGSKFEDCDIGIKLVVPAENSYVRRNLVDDCDLGMTIYVDPSHTYPCNVSNNIVINSEGNGVEDGGDIPVFNNNIVGWSGGDGLYSTSELSSNTIENNIFISNGGFGVQANSGTVNNNCFYSNTSGAVSGPSNSNPVLADPTFVLGYGGENYYRLKWNSPCLGEGLGTNNNPASSTADIGAYGGPELDPGEESILMSLSEP